MSINSYDKIIMRGEIMVERGKVNYKNDDILFASEAAEYLNISMQRLNKLVHEKKISPFKTSKAGTLFLKSELEKRVIKENSMSSITVTQKFDISSTFIKQVIKYFTVQSLFNNNDRKTQRFFEKFNYYIEVNSIEEKKHYYREFYKQLAVSEEKFLSEYKRVLMSFETLQNDVVIIEKGSPEYPSLLAETDNAPMYLFLKGDISLLKEKSVCVVGSRNAEKDALEKTESIVNKLIIRNIVVNAGLAKGIDTATHSSALDNGGKTIAVIGTPINKYYPKENKEIQMRIENEGLVVSQFPPSANTTRINFPLRNATMSGISLATIIMEAGETSGALKQADYALKQKRDVLIPSSVVKKQHLKWPTIYIQRGAKEFTTIIDALIILSNNENLRNNVEMISSKGESVDVEMDGIY